MKKPHKADNKKLHEAKDEAFRLLALGLEVEILKGQMTKKLKDDAGQPESLEEEQTKRAAQAKRKRSTKISSAKPRGRPKKEASPQRKPRKK
jgi:hypothetical protein